MTEQTADNATPIFPAKLISFGRLHDAEPVSYKDILKHEEEQKKDRIVHKGTPKTQSVFDTPHEKFFQESNPDAYIIPKSHYAVAGAERTLIVPELNVGLIAGIHYFAPRFSLVAHFTPSEYESKEGNHSHVIAARRATLLILRKYGFPAQLPDHRVVFIGASTHFHKDINHKERVKEFEHYFRNFGFSVADTSTEGYVALDSKIVRAWKHEVGTGKIDLVIGVHPHHRSKTPQTRYSQHHPSNLLRPGAPEQPKTKTTSLEHLLVTPEGLTRYKHASDLPSTYT